MAEQSPVSPTGAQWVIAHGHQEAVVTEVGATLRSFRIGDREIVDGFGAAQWSHSGRGQVLAPWPNRLGDGRYEWRGVRAQAALDEPAHANAIHGLVRWLPWQLEGHAQNVVSLRCRLLPTPGYPWSVELRIEYRLRRDGLVVSTRARAAGDDAAPFGIGFHPYLRAGDGSVDGALFTLPASRRLVLDGRGLPAGQELEVTGSPFDFTGGRRIGPVELDTAYTELARGADGMARAALEDPVSGRGVELWVDDRFRYLMCFTGDTVDDPARRRRSIAVEPMTCPPDALRSGTDLIVLEPGEIWEGAWGIRPY